MEWQLQASQNLLLVLGLAYSVPQNHRMMSPALRRKWFGCLHERLAKNRPDLTAKQIKQAVTFERKRQGI
jgi:hypothetical protein